MDKRRVAEELIAVDVVVIGGGPAGLAAALWVARYRRRVLLVDGGRPRNTPTVATHGYLGTDGADPWELVLFRAKDLLDYPEVTFVAGAEAVAVEADDGGFEVVLDDGRTVRALRLILATGVVDVLPSIDRFGEFYGSSAFTCPTCDGYEAQNKTIVVIGDHDDLGAFAVGMLDWASAVTVIVEPTSTDAPAADLDKVNDAGIDVVIGMPAALLGDAGTLEGVRLTDGSVVPCDMLFFAADHVQHSNLATASVARFLTKDALSSMRTAEPRSRTSSRPETSSGPSPRPGRRRRGHRRGYRRGPLASAASPALPARRVRTRSEQCAQRMSRHGRRPRLARARSDRMGLVWMI